MSDTVAALQALLDRWQAHHASLETGHASIGFDAEWPSPCEIEGSRSGDEIGWQPVKRDQPGDFANVEEALDIELHPSIKAYYGHFFSGELQLAHAKGPVFLLQVWNEDDFANLQQNLIGHIMMKRQLRQDITLFFALTDLEEQMISIVNETGEVWLENVGKPPHLKLADTMAEFLGLLKVPGEV